MSPIPGPRGLPFLGETGSVLRFFRDPIRVMQRLHTSYGKVAAVTGGQSSVICAFGPELNNAVLSNPDLFHNAAEIPVRIPKGSSLERLTNFLVGRNGEDHRNLRKAMAPLFAKGHLEVHRERIVATTNSVISRWREGEELELSSATAELALSVAFRCLFDLDVEKDARRFAALALAFTGGATSMAVAAAPVDLPGTPYRKFLRTCDELEGVVAALIAERRPTAHERHDALSVLMNVEPKLSDTLLVGLANELFIAGHETTARTLCWTLFLLERHPQVMEAVVAELAQVLRGEAPTLEQLEQLPLLDAAVKESMRLLSATPFMFFRRTTKEAQLGGFDIPANARIIISPLMTHHMEELYPDAQRFKPERWTSTSPKPYAYLPFGAGPRMCLGAAFATMSLRTMLAVILQRFRFAVPAGTQVDHQVRGIILGTKSGLRMRLDDRNRASSVGGTVNELVHLH